MRTRPTKIQYVALLLGTWLFLSSHVNAQFDETFITSHSIRVVAKAGGKAKAASGFLWKSSNQVVTSLHAIPAGSEISVECRGVSKSARVSKVLAKADLILLSVEGLPEACQPFTEFHGVKPKRDTSLWTFGYHAGAKSLTDRKFQKGFASPERLDYLLSGKSLEAIKQLGFPATNLDIYYVQGGLLPGYSGGPVVDENKRLIGIVDGGLNKGASAYNWVIPAKFLDELTSSTVSKISTGSNQNTDLHFASGIAEADDSSVIEYTQDETAYKWVLTKTQSLSDLAETADDFEGVAVLYLGFEKAAGLNDPKQLIFDIYEEQEQQLIIAVPAGQSLVFGDDGSGENRLHSIGEASNSKIGQISFLTAEGWVENSLGEDVSAEKPDYFQHYVAGAVAKCQKPLIVECLYLETLTRIIDFGGGNKILRFAIAEAHFVSGRPKGVEYYTVAASEDYTLEAKAKILTLGEAGLWQCSLDETAKACGDTATATNQLMQMLAVHLTSFTELQQTGGEQRPADTKITFDNKDDNASTMLVPYFDGENLRFFNTRGKIWSVFEDGEEYQAVEVDQNQDGMVTLKYLDSYYYRLPILGGAYLEWSDDSEPKVVGELRKVTRSTMTAYFEGETTKFLNTGGEYWLVYDSTEGYSQSTEVRRETDESGAHLAILEFDDIRYAIPLAGGEYYQSKPGSDWVVGGVVEGFTE